MGYVRVRWIVKGAGNTYTVSVDSWKGGVIEKTLKL
jgi:hypothetical protein